MIVKETVYEHKGLPLSIRVEDRKIPETRETVYVSEYRIRDRGTLRIGYSRGWYGLANDAHSAAIRAARDCAELIAP
jgi:hypothetical protein